MIPPSDDDDDLHVCTVFRAVSTNDRHTAGLHFLLISQLVTNYSCIVQLFSLTLEHDPMMTP